MNPNDSVLGAALGFYMCLVIAFGLWLIGHYAGVGGRRARAFHRRGVARLRAHRARQENPLG